ncbi:MAG: isochorismatase family protein [Lentimicrobium sp.]|jgi:nicotinamidase-related amidase|nr:isochorismatase family protein [Lentimicrobium sp.]
MKLTITIALTFIFTLLSISAKSQDKNVLINKFIIVLDVQEYHTNCSLSDPSNQKVIDSINYVINKSDRNNVIYIKRIHKLLNISLSFPFIYVSLDTTAMRLDKRLNLVNENIFTREKANAFTLEELNDFLKQNNVKEIVMIGFLAEEFLYQSVIRGKELGYDMYMISEAIIGKSQKSKDKVIKNLTEEGIKMLDIEKM